MRNLSSFTWYFDLLSLQQFEIFEAPQKFETKKCNYITDWLIDWLIDC